jgi:hypothetical protein
MKRWQGRIKSLSGRSGAQDNTMFAFQKMLDTNMGCIESDCTSSFLPQLIKTN